MIPKGLFSQLIVVVVSIAIVFFYIKPSFEKVKETQTKRETYEIERGKIIAVNSQLAELVSRVDSVSAGDKLRLLTYLPNSIDELAISRDLNLITQESGVIYKDVKYDEAISRDKKVATEGGPAEPVTHRFTLSVEGTYEQIKDLFMLLEQNNYPLEVQEVSITKSEGGYLEVTMSIATFAFYNESIESNL